jgi:hypothetical protein
MWAAAMIGDCCWFLQRKDETIYKWKNNFLRFEF